MDKQNKGETFSAEEFERFQQQEEQRAAAEVQKKNVLKTIMDSEAFERLNRIAIVKPETVARAEAAVLQIYRSQPGGVVSDATLLQILKAIQGGGDDEGATRQGPRVQIQRRRNVLSDDSD